MKTSNIIKYLKNPRMIWVLMSSYGILNWISDKTFIKIAYRAHTGNKLNLENPTTFNEKLQWLKLYDRRPIYTTMVDKYEAKKYVEKRIGEGYVIPTLGVWDRFEDIDFDSLPEQFVLKCTHDSGGIVICKNKNNFDKVSAKNKIEESLKRNYFWGGREWPYKNVKPRIIAEKYMVDESGYELKDYKFFCFDGFAKAMYVAMDRQAVDTEMHWNFYDMDFKMLPFWKAHPNAVADIRCPETFEKMKALAEKLSKDIPHVRVDFYNINDQVYFGELTFFHNSGFSKFHPEEWDKKLGEWIKLPDSIGGGT